MHHQLTTAAMTMTALCFWWIMIAPSAEAFGLVGRKANELHYIPRAKTAMAKLTRTYGAGFAWGPTEKKSSHRRKRNAQQQYPRAMTKLQTSASDTTLSTKPAFDAAVMYRHACKKFQRFDDTDRNVGASKSDPAVVQQTIQALELARLSPSAYNAQPYKFVLVHSNEQKEALARFALGPNRNRVLDSDVTVVFLADRQVLRTLPLFRKQLASPNKWSRRKILLYLAIFSSGYPLPRFMSAILSFLIRTSVAFVHLFTRRFYPMPTLSSAETWSTKQALMVAMTYMLACASRGLDTIPMEGIHAGGIRRALGVPSRYAVPLIVSTGRAFAPPNAGDSTIGATTAGAARQRYPMEEMMFGNKFGEALSLTN